MPNASIDGIKVMIPNLIVLSLSFELVDSLRESDFRCTTSYLISTVSMTVRYHPQSFLFSY